MSTELMNETPTRSTYESGLGDWVKQEKAAIELIKIMGTLWYDRSVELIMFRNQLVDRSASQILALMQYAKEMVKKPISIFDALMIAEELVKVHLAPSRIDLGRLTSEWINEKNHYNGSASSFIGDKLRDYIGEEKRKIVPKDVVLYGFGRIGRILARELVAQAGKGEQLRLRAIVTRDKSDEDLIKRAELLRNDSVHGSFLGTIVEDVANRTLIINGHTVHMISAKSPDEIDYTAYGINDALLIDNTGVYRDRAGLSRHLYTKGISNVLLTAPRK
ncbi:MAG: glyceraldehyde 3-phosphate dehydrogenase NAD-binding domain-containing protein, partial [Bacteroidia bacterium]